MDMEDSAGGARKATKSKLFEFLVHGVCCGLLLCPEHLQSNLESQRLAETYRDLHQFPQRPHVHIPLPPHSDVLRLDLAWTPLELGLLWEAMLRS